MNDCLSLKVSNNEQEKVAECVNFFKNFNTNSKDNILLCNEENSEKEVFLVTHGSPNGTVFFKRNFLTLKEVFQQLKLENIFNILKATGIKYIQVLCCYGKYQTSYTEDGITICPYFVNEGVLSVYQASGYLMFLPNLS